jgi:hypothetical protein
MKKRIFAIICLLFTIPCQGRTITVDDDGPADFAVIWLAVEDANSGDTILVADGTYFPGSPIEGKSITVRSKNGPSNCIIDCQGPNPIPGAEYFGFFINPDAPDCVIDGFTITRALITHSYMAGGVTCQVGTVVRNCIFEECYSQYLGAAIGVNRSCGSDGPLVINCTFVNNLSTAVVIRGGGYDKITLRNCISWANPTPDLAAYPSSKCGIPKIDAEFSILQVDWYNSVNCFVADPCFANPLNGDYHLKSQAGRWDPNSQTWVQDSVTSVAIDAGNPMDPVGLEPFPNGGIINMGAYGSTAEASKSYFGGAPCQTIVAGDINGDCIIDFKDFGLMALHWLDNNNQ